MRCELRTIRFGEQGDVQVANLKELMCTAPMSKETHAAVQRRRVEIRRRMEDLREEQYADDTSH
jgi:hypothetical protein